MAEIQTKNKAKTPRVLAADSLISLEKNGRYSNLEIDSALKNTDLAQADRALYTRLVYGVTERRITLDYIISQYSRIAIDELDADVKTALRLGIYQLLFMDRIPAHAAVSESANLVPRSKAGYVNAVLRTLQRAGLSYDLPKEDDRIHYLSVKYSVPEDLVRVFDETCGDECEALLEALNREPKIGIRVNTLKTSVEEAVQLTDGTASKIARDVIKVDGLSENVKRGINEGLWFVQDEASYITALSVGAIPGEYVIDTCACPGGKSFSLAINMQNKGEIHSFDLHKNKLSLIRSGADRLGISIITTKEVDGRAPLEELFGTADRVLCDAPCSGLGVIAKKPDIRYKKIADIERLPEIQYAILTGASKYVKDGGVLVYSTCTINKRENEDVVLRFLADNPAFRLTEDESLGGGMKTFLPHKDGCDGFFAAKMIKTN
jgi:16S rRNA (cytosine967-C5)-methyltransferase